VAEQSGAKSQVAGVIGAGLVVLLLVLLPGLLSDLPQTALAAVVIAAALSLMNIPELVRYAKVRPSALILSLVATGGVIFFGVLEGIGIAIVLAVLMFFRRSWWPHGAVLGRVDGVEGWHNVKDYPGAREVAEAKVFRWEAPLFFANAGAFREEVRTFVRSDHPQWVVIQCEAITDIDVTAAEMLAQLDQELNAEGIHMAFAEMRQRIQEHALAYGLFDTLDRDHFYPTLDAALEAIREGRT
jgi:MFS superfamily sulfate permease-like transporter